MKMRARKLRNIEERFSIYADAIESDPCSWKGNWKHWRSGCASDSEEPIDATWSGVMLDLGCGKGASTVENALDNPDVLYVGVDIVDSCVVLSAQKALEAGARNAVFIQANADDILDIFGQNELDGIYLNFPSPFPKKKYASKRLTHIDHLATYRVILKDGAKLRFKTDSKPLFEFSLIQFEIANYITQWISWDLDASDDSHHLTGYESRLLAKGAKIMAIDLVAGEEPAQMEQRAPLGLIEYLPEDLSELDYVPYGMEETVKNMRSRQARAQRRAEREAHTKTESSAS